MYEKQNFKNQERGCMQLLRSNASPPTKRPCGLDVALIGAPVLRSKANEAWWSDTAKTACGDWSPFGAAILSVDPASIAARGNNGR